ncbi:MAG: polymorphic toxin type 35 domain-containing protein [Thermoactinomyces sp.]
MKTHLYRWIIVLLIAVAGCGFFGSGTGYANPDGGSFEVPDVQKDFEQFEQVPQPLEETPVSPNVQAEESGIWDEITQPFKSAWNWAKEKVSDTWEWSKDIVSAAWDGIVESISKIADVLVNAGTAMWNWILEHKGPVVNILSILGVVVAVIGFIFSAPVAVMIGGAILIGELVSGLFSWISGNGLFSDEMLLDMLIGGIAGGIASLFGWAAGVGAVGSSVVRWLGTRIPWLGRAFPKIFGGSVGAGVDQSVWDLLKEGKINWKNTLIAGGLGFVMLLGGEHVGVKFFKNCVAYEQPTNSYLAVMPPKLDCFYSPDRGGGSGSGFTKSNGIIQAELKVDEILQKENKKRHIFSADHEKKGIMDLGKDRRDIIEKLVTVINDLDKQKKLNEGHNVIHTKISGHLVEIKVFIKNGKVLSLDAFKGQSNRWKKVIQYPGIL